MYLPKSLRRDVSPYLKGFTGIKVSENEEREREKSQVLFEAKALRSEESLSEIFGDDFSLSAKDEYLLLVKKEELVKRASKLGWEVSQGWQDVEALVKDLEKFEV